MSRNFLNELAQFQTELSEFSDDYLEDADNDERDEEFKETLLKIMRKAVDVVANAQKDEAENLPGIVEKAESLLNEAISLAYEGSTDESDLGQSLFESLDSFAHTVEHPLAKPPPEAEGVFPHRIVKVGLMMMKMMGAFFNPDPSKPLPRAPAPWKKVIRLHPSSTRCARFSNAIPDSAPPGDKPQALSVFQARAEVSMGEIEEPTSIYASSSGKCFIVPVAGGYKGRAPYLYTFYSEDQPSDYLEGRCKILGLADLATHGAVDDESGLSFVGDSNRIKSYSWWDPEKNSARRNLVPVHTLNSKGFENSIGILPNGRLARAGKGKLAIWNLNDLPTHRETKGLIGGNIAEDDEDLDTWRDDPEEIERSSGSLPHTTINLPDEDLNISLWHNHPNATGNILISTASGQNSQYYCRSLDLENGGKVTARYLGHGGTINQFSTSKADPTIFVTAADDGIARLYDVRQPLPVLSIQAGLGGQNCSSAVVCHPDGIPYIFTSEQEEEAIALWDVRSQAVVYELATGNNRVIEGGMFWNDSRNELYAATSCNFVDRNGRHFDYEPAKIPVNRDRSDNDEDGNTDDEDDDEEYEDTDQCWPKNAYHNETYFGHTFDSGDHRIYRYAFKSEPNPEIVPPDGGAMADEGNGLW